MGHPFHAAGIQLLPLQACPASYAILVFYHPVRVNETTHHMEFKPEPMKVPVDRARGEKLFKQAVACLCGEEPKAAGGLPCLPGCLGVNRFNHGRRSRRLAGAATTSQSGLLFLRPPLML